MSRNWLRSKVEDVATNIIAWAIVAFGVGLILAIWALVQSVEAPAVVAVFIAGAAGTFDAITAISRSRSSTPTKTAAPPVRREPVAVMHEGIRWVWTGGYYVGTGGPIGRAECPEHKVALLHRDAGEDSYRLPHDSDIVDEARDQWLECPYEKWSPDQGGHTFFFLSTETKFGTAQIKAELLLQAKITAEGRA